MTDSTEAEALTWVTDKIAITNFVSAHNAKLLAANGVKAILCLDGELRGDSAEQRAVDCVTVAHLVDGANPPATFRRAVSSLRELLGSHERVVVHCRAGRSRSVAVVAAYLAVANHLSADEALELLKAKRPSAVAPELVGLLRTFVQGV